MIDIENPNIPMMSDEGLTKIMQEYSNLYSQGLYEFPSQKYIVNLIQLTTDSEPTEHNRQEYESNENMYSIEIVFSLLKAMKEDKEKYGYEDYIEEIRKQSNSVGIFKYMNSYEIESALNFLDRLEWSKEKMEEYIQTGRIKEMPSLLQYLFYHNTFESPVGDIREIPYVASKEITDVGGRKWFRIYLNNPISKSGLDFYLIFVNKLIEKRIPYNNKFNWHLEKERKDKSIFYFSVDYLNDVTQILDTISDEYPELTSKFGTPPTACAQSTYYGLSHTGATFRMRNRTYNMLINDVTSYAFFIYFCKQIKMHGAIYSKMTEEEKEIIKKYSQGVANPYIFNVIISPGKVDMDTRNYELLMISKIVSKYGGQFKVAISTLDYKNILKQVSSVRMYGDLEHTDSPICFNETFYSAPVPSKKL